MSLTKTSTAALEAYNNFIVYTCNGVIRLADGSSKVHFRTSTWSSVYMPQLSEARTDIVINDSDRELRPSTPDNGVFLTYVGLLSRAGALTSLC